MNINTNLVLTDIILRNIRYLRRTSVNVNNNLGENDTGSCTVNIISFLSVNIKNNVSEFDSIVHSKTSRVSR